MEKSNTVIPCTRTGSSGIVKFRTDQPSKCSRLIVQSARWTAHLPFPYRDILANRPRIKSSC